MTLLKLVFTKRNKICLKIKAYVITPSTAEIVEVTSKVEHFNTAGGYGSSVPYSQQDATSDKKLLARKNQQLHQYYKRLEELLADVDALYIFGPGETKLGFAKYLEANVVLNNKIVGVETDDSMTENQLKAKVRHFFTHA